MRIHAALQPRRVGREAELVRGPPDVDDAPRPRQDVAHRERRRVVAACERAELAGERQAVGDDTHLESGRGGAGEGGGGGKR